MGNVPACEWRVVERSRRGNGEGCDHTVADDDRGGQLGSTRVEPVSAARRKQRPGRTAKSAGCAARTFPVGPGGQGGQKGTPQSAIPSK